MNRLNHHHLRNLLCWLQGSYYFITGVWPLVSIRSFQWVTGPKTDNMPTGREADHWLVMTVSLLIVSIAVTLLVAAYRKSEAPELTVLALLAAIGLTSIDVTYVARGVIAPVYLLDAALEVPLILGWLTVAAFDLGNQGSTSSEGVGSGSWRFRGQRRPSS